MSRTSRKPGPVPKSNNDDSLLARPSKMSRFGPQRRPTSAAATAATRAGAAATRTSAATTRTSTATTRTRTATTRTSAATTRGSAAMARTGAATTGTSAATPRTSTATPESSTPRGNTPHRPATARNGAQNRLTYDRPPATKIDYGSDPSADPTLTVTQLLQFSNPYSYLALTVQQPLQLYIALTVPPPSTFLRSHRNFLR